jgi:O-antigen/teichoic acid export membrane protein
MGLEMTALPPDELPGLGTRAARGAALTLGGQGARLVVQVISVVVLARLLTPDDYGLIAMVVSVVGIGEIFRDFGLSSAAIQARELSTPQRSNLFWLNSLIGVLLAAVVAIGAGLLAALYGRQELVPIAQVLSVTFVLNGLATQFRATLVRDLRFRALAIADAAAPAIALAAAIGAAVAGWGYWALVVQQVALALALLILFAIAARWLPGPPRRAPMRGLVTFGWNIVASQLIGYVANNVDSVIIGVRFGAGPLGIYNRAFHLLMTPLNQVRTPLTSVALPVLSRLADDGRRFGDFVARGQVALGYTLVVGLAIVIGSSEPLTLLLLGERWQSVEPILRLLAVAGVFQTLAFVGYWVYLARGLTGALVRYSLVSAAIKIACIVVGSLWGVVGVAVGYAIAPALSWPISLWWLSRLTPMPTRRLYAGAARILATVTLAATAAALGTALARPWGSALQLVAGCVAALASYALAVLAVPPVRRDVADVVAMARMIGRPGAAARRQRG